MLAIIGGTSLLESALFAGLNVETVTTARGPACVLRNDDVLFIQRHGHPATTPPHRINHHANIQAIADAGIDTIVAVNSTGSLTPDIKPGTLVIPDDYFNLYNPPTFFDDALHFTVPGIDDAVRQRLMTACSAIQASARSHGVYVQVQGPILETPAEIRFLGSLGDVVGMTMAHEAILARELGLAYASVCMVDNFANGIGDRALTLDEIDTTRSRNLVVIERLLGHLMTMDC